MEQPAGRPRRVRIFEKGGSAAKLVVVGENATLSELLLACGKKLGIKALQLFLDDRCEVESIDEVQDGDSLFVVGVKEDFPGSEDVLTLQDGSYSSGVLGGSALADADFRKMMAGGLGSLARRMDELGSQVGHLEQNLHQLIDVMRQNGVVLAQQQHLEEKKEAAAAISAAAATAAAAAAAAAAPAGGDGGNDVRRKAAQSERIWRVAQTLEGHTGPVWCLVAVEMRNILISGSSDTTIKVRRSAIDLQLVLTCRLRCGTFSRSSVGTR